ncbi:hypothetical protein PanWU01x14_150730 [Parasponia andersonii]|uniref:Uncharacterized protein n=1 Tax=Parasponia andersonii TaxID=3476 RepID=A0A2P5CI45_PARAD|nr:hypothetical protein PanWU01x14_150730 [Parasponia andersonii]
MTSRQDNVIFMDSIEQSMMHYLRDWKNNMKMHFITVGEKEALAVARARPYKNVPEDHWEILCDHFASQDFEGNPETGKLMSPIDYFEERHFKNNSWRNEYTQQKHMVAWREEALTQAQAQAHEIADLVDPTLSVESVVGPVAIDEYAIMTQSLGTRSRWQKEVSSLPRLKNVGGPKAASISNVAAVQCEHAETITNLKQ